MPNPNHVQTEKLKAKQFKPYGKVDVPLCKNNTQIKLPVDVTVGLDQLPSRDLPKAGTTRSLYLFTKDN